MTAEYRKGCLQRDSVEHEEYAGAPSIIHPRGGKRQCDDLLEGIQNRAYKRVKGNQGAAGIDGMTVEEALPWLREHREKLLQSLWDGRYTPSPVRRKEIPKPEGGVRKLGIPTVIDRIIQQASAQKWQGIYESLFADSSYDMKQYNPIPHPDLQRCTGKTGEPVEKSLFQSGTENAVQRPCFSLTAACTCTPRPEPCAR